MEGTHEAIISVRDFKIVQELLREDTHSFDADGTTPAYGGRIFCGDCGAPAVRKTHRLSNKRVVYYSCGAHKKDKYFCSKHTIREDVLDKVVFETIRQQTVLLLDVDKALQKYEALSWEKHKLRRIEDNIAIQNEIVQKNSMLRLGIYEDFKSGLLDRAEYDTLKAELTDRINEATASIEYLSSEKREIEEGITKQQSWISQFRQYENITEITRNMVIHLIERINVFEDSVVEIIFRHQDQIKEILEYVD